MEKKKSADTLTDRLNEHENRAKAFGIAQGRAGSDLI
jgi:hypothetical protein